MAGFLRPRVLLPLLVVMAALGVGGCVAYPAADYGYGGYYRQPTYGSAVVTYGGGYGGYYAPPPRYRHHHYHGYRGW
ncbi:MAG: hypothetical protein AB7F35_03495 [Acetobacteraceae bacterium]